MSADNFVGVYYETNNCWFVSYGSASVEQEDCMYRGRTVANHETRADALLAAHDYAKTLPVLEYGVIELPAIPEKPCGLCWVCINERGIVSPDVPRCDGCGKPIASCSWAVMTKGKTFHSICEPGRC